MFSVSLAKRAKFAEFAKGNRALSAPAFTLAFFACLARDFRFQRRTSRSYGSR
jgi:hypothetical protein